MSKLKLNWKAGVVLGALSVIILFAFYWYLLRDVQERMGDMGKDEQEGVGDFYVNGSFEIPLIDNLRVRKADLRDNGDKIEVQFYYEKDWQEGLEIYREKLKEEGWKVRPKTNLARGVILATSEDSSGGLLTVMGEGEKEEGAYMIFSLNKK